MKKVKQSKQSRLPRALDQETLVTVTGGDSVSGNATGRRQYKPVELTAELDASMIDAPLDVRTGQ